MATNATPIITISSSSAPSSTQKGTSSHRLPTQSASAALQAINDDDDDDDDERGSGAFISTGMKGLDQVLTGNSGLRRAGWERGRVGEVWGVPGGGKSCLAFQTACEAIRDGGEVVWIDCATRLGASKLKLLNQSQETSPSSQSSSKKEHVSSKFHYLPLPTLSHLLAQIIHPSPTFPPPKTSLLILDNINTLLDLDFPRTGYSPSASRTESQKWQQNRRYSILGSLISALNKLALLHNLAVLVTTGCNSKMRTGEGAAVGPGIGGSEWEAGVHSRIVMFRDFGGRYVGVQKVNGRNLYPLDPVSDVRNIVGVEIDGEGRLGERVVDLTSSPAGGGRGAGEKVVVPETTVQKVVAPRKRTYDEIADSEEDEDVDEYGWAERDDEDIVVVDPPTVYAADATIQDVAEPQQQQQKVSEHPANNDEETTKLSQSTPDQNHE